MPSSPGNRQHSLRSACERCRLHKLKCTIVPQKRFEGPQEAPGQCTRCARAKAKCVFGRRAPPKHRASSSTDRSSVSKGTNSTTPATRTMQPNAMGFVGSHRIELPPSPASNQSSLKHSSVWDNLLDKTTPQEPRADFSSFSYPPVPFDLQSMCLDEVDMAASALPTTEPNFSSAQREHEFSAMSMSPVLGYDNLDELIALNEQPNISDASSPLLSETDPSHSMIRLSSLLKEIHETQHNLQERSFSCTTSRGLAGYPIGRVLHAAHTFSSMVTNLMRPRVVQTSHTDVQGFNPSLYSSSPESTDLSSLHQEFVSSLEQMKMNALEQSRRLGEDDLDKYASPCSSTTSLQDTMLDTPVVMLVFCCFTSLSKLYCSVFRFFEKSLHSQPCRTYVPPLQDTRTLQLGELSIENDTEFKVLKALRMLLDAFQAAEASLGLPSSLTVLDSNKSTISASAEPAVSDTGSLQHHLRHSLIKQCVTFDDRHLERTLTSLVTHVENLKELLRVQNGLH